jgi:glycosyltransferase involved in cell wall biosynthesis
MTDTDPLVSVVLCTYNGAKYIREQMDSIIEQTYTNTEIVIVDDGSTDETIAILQDYQKKDSRIAIYQNENNLGYNRNFEKAVQLANGKYIAISDQDDIWDHHKIEICIRSFPADALFLYSLSGSFQEADFTNRKWAPKVYYRAIDDLHQLVFNSPVHGHACIFKKGLLPYCLPFPSDIFYDWWLSMHAASVSTIACLPQTLTWHRNHEKNASRGTMQIKDTKERHRQLREQIIFSLESFFKKGIAPDAQKKSLQQFASLLKEIKEPRFSLTMFRYLIKNRKKVFHYKRKPLVIISHFKHAYRMARTGIL